MAAAKNKIVMGSENYIWLTRDLLGTGAMGMVYIGRHRKKGDKVAVKQFKQELKMIPKDYAGNELALMKSIPKHDFIVNLIAIEHETHSKDPVMIMELCTGSLLDELEKPKNVNGLKEDELIQVLLQIGSALKHLHGLNIVHRDVKPGNILIYISPDDSHQFKLADFGTSKQITDGSFSSLCGTEEYLHPDIHYAAFINKKSSRNFRLNCDIWSFGVVIYQCATGTMPFQPRSGIRKDQHTMQELMRNKGRNIISQEETDSGTIRRERLPDSCPLSSGTQIEIVKILRVIFNTTDPVNPDTFFSELNHLRKQIKVYAFVLDKASEFSVYVGENSSLSSVKKMLEEQTGIDPKDQFVMHNDRIVQDFLDESSDPKVSSLKILTGDSPLFVMSTYQQGVYRQSKLPSLPLDDNDGSLSKDAAWARLTYSYVLHLHNAETQIVQAQKNIFQILSTYKSLMRMKFTEMSEKFAHLKSFLHLIHKIAPSNNGMTMFHREFDNFDVFKILKEFNFDRRAECDIRKCVNMSGKFEREALESYVHIRGDARKELKHNDMEIHKYHKSELRRSFRRIDVLLQKCLLKLNGVHQDALFQMRKMWNLQLKYEELQTKCEEEIGRILSHLTTATMSKNPPNLHKASYNYPMAFSHATLGVINASPQDDSMPLISEISHQCTERSHDTNLILGNNGDEALLIDLNDSGLSDMNQNCLEFSNKRKEMSINPVEKQQTFVKELSAMDNAYTNDDMACDVPDYGNLTSGLIYNGVSDLSCRCAAVESNVTSPSPVDVHLIGGGARPKTTTPLAINPGLPNSRRVLEEISQLKKTAADTVLIAKKATCEMKAIINNIPR